MTKYINITNSGTSGDYIEILVTQMGAKGHAYVRSGWAELYISKI